MQLLIASALAKIFILDGHSLYKLKHECTCASVSTLCSPFVITLFYQV